MKEKAIFLDRDGTIIVDKHYMHSLEEMEFLDRAVEGLRKLQEMGFLLIILTNQSGIGRGYFTKGEYEIFQQVLLRRLKRAGVTITATYYCPHIDSDRCICRKPNLGLFERAIKEFQIDLGHSYAIGDHIRDLAIYKSDPCRGFLIDKKKKVKTDFRTVTSLEEAAEYIARDTYERGMISNV